MLIHDEPGLPMSHYVKTLKCHDGNWLAHVLEMDLSPWPIANGIILEFGEC